MQPVIAPPAPAPAPKAPAGGRASAARVAVVLCAGWCRTCDAFVPELDGLQAAHPEIDWHWIDIEDEADLVGDVDIQTFPTLLIADAGRPWFAGPVLPKAEVVERLLAQPVGAARGGRGAVEDEAELAALVAALRGRAPRRPGDQPPNGKK